VTPFSSLLFGLKILFISIFSIPVLSHAIPSHPSRKSPLTYPFNSYFFPDLNSRTAIKL
jgi:hypothetical protein